MNTAAVNFEYEWMADGSLLRLRFLNREDEILGQQTVAAEGLLALQTLIGLATAKSTDVEPQKLLALLRTCGFEAGLSDVEFLKEATRVRAGITPEGGVEFRTLEDE